MEIKRSASRWILKSLTVYFLRGNVGPANAFHLVSSSKIVKFLAKFVCSKFEIRIDAAANDTNSSPLLSMNTQTFSNTIHCKRRNDSSSLTF